MSYGNDDGFGSVNQPPKKSNALWWILGILGVLTVGGALVCCGGVYFSFRFVSEAIGEQVKLAVNSEPAIQEHIGTISEINLNFTATAQGGGGDKFIFDVKGEKGTGQLEVVMNTGEGEQTIQSCVLVLPNGDRHEVMLKPSLDTSIPNVTEGESVPVIDDTDAETEPANETTPESAPADTESTVPAEADTPVSEPAATEPAATN